MLYEYPDEFIVPITYLTSSIDNKEHKTIKKEDIISSNTEIVKDISKKDKQRDKIHMKRSMKHKTRKEYREEECSNNILSYLVEENLISDSQKDYFIENGSIYSDIDNEYAKEQSKNKK